MFWKRKPTYTPPPPKPMVARFTIHMRDGGKLTCNEEYNGACGWYKPEPVCHDGMVRVGNYWVNRDEIEGISVEYDEMPVSY